MTLVDRLDSPTLAIVRHCQARNYAVWRLVTVIEHQFADGDRVK